VSERRERTVERSHPDGSCVPEAKRGSAGTIVLNGSPTEPVATVADLLERQLGVREPHGIAVAVDGEVVPRAQWPYRSLPEGSVVEIVTAVQGG
jgi:sulfur carrier protein